MSVSRVSASRIDTGPVEGAVTALRLPHPSPFFAFARLLLNTTIPAIPAWFLLLYVMSGATHMRRGLAELLYFVELLSQRIPIIGVMRDWEIYFSDFHYMRFAVLVLTIFLTVYTRISALCSNFIEYSFNLNFSSLFLGNIVLRHINCRHIYDDEFSLLCILKEFNCIQFKAKFACTYTMV